MGIIENHKSRIYILKKIKFKIIKKTFITHNTFIDPAQIIHISPPNKFSFCHIKKIRTIPPDYSSTINKCNLVELNIKSIYLIKDIKTFLPLWSILNKICMNWYSKWLKQNIIFITPILPRFTRIFKIIKTTIFIRMFWIF